MNHHHRMLLYKEIRIRKISQLYFHYHSKILVMSDCKSLVFLHSFSFFYLRTESLDPFHTYMKTLTLSSAEQAGLRRICFLIFEKKLAKWKKESLCLCWKKGSKWIKFVGANNVLGKILVTFILQIPIKNTQCNLSLALHTSCLTKQNR